jgi:hypothetical protein
MRYLSNGCSGAAPLAIISSPIGPQKGDPIAIVRTKARAGFTYAFLPMLFNYKHVTNNNDIFIVLDHIQGKLMQRHD